MKTSLMIFFVACCFSAQAHIGSPNVFLEDKAGEYPVRVVIRPPNVVPGLAEITVRVQEPVHRVTVLPVFWKAGREGSPLPDEAKLVHGETNLYSAQLWLMTSGAYSVDVTVEGSRGRGTLVVPVNAMATNTRPMPMGYRVMLCVLGGVLFLGALKIASAIFAESRLEPGLVPTNKDRWRGRIAMACTALLLSLLLFVGKKWWDRDDFRYRHNSLYKPLPVSANVQIKQDQPILQINVDASTRRGSWTPLIPDHGKLMHLFLVRDGEPSAFAHLHPVQRNEEKFEVPLPPLPEGSYHIYADVTHEDGFSETLVARAEIPPASPAMKRLWLGNSAEPICSATVSQRLASSLIFPPDPDDSWQMNTATALQKNRTAKNVTEQIVDVGPGYKMVWENPNAITENFDTSLRFKLLTSDDQPVQIEPYMGMLGHAVVRRQDGAVFAHVHPVGTFSMAAREFFINDQSQNSTLGKQSKKTDYKQSSLSPKIHESHTNWISAAGEVSFPYAFPEPGTYRIWVQMKSQGRIVTGVFDTAVAAAK